MANALSVGNHVLVRVWCKDTDQASVTSLAYIVAAVGGSPATDQDVADQFSGYLAPLFAALMNNNAEYRGVQVQQRFPPLFLPYVTVFQNTDATAGTAGATALPRQSAGLISYQTGFAGRANRGRSYIPFPSAQNNDPAGIPNATYLGNLSALAAAIGVGAGISQGGRTATLVRVITHYTKPGDPVKPPTPVLAISYADKWATQRRRGSYGRLNSSPI